MPVVVLLFGIRMQQLYANIDFWLGGTERNPFGNNQVCERLPNSFSASVQRWETSFVAPLFLGADFSVN
jgi:hypothetical protein